VAHFNSLFTMTTAGDGVTRHRVRQP